MSFTQVYVFVRLDLTHPQQVVQACHACLGLTRPVDEVPSVIVIGIKSEEKLKGVIEYLKSINLDFSEFREPDLDNQLTAVATEPVREADKGLFRRYQLLKGGQYKTGD